MGKKKSKPKHVERQIMDTPTSVGAGVLGLCGFLVATLAGLVVGVEPIPLLMRSIVSMLACAGLGWVLGRACQALATERIEAYEREHPVPDPVDPLHDAERGQHGRAA